MNRRQLWHAIRASCSIAGIDSVIIVGSQSILGSFDENALPHDATLSQEIDVLPDVQDEARIESLSDLIEGVGGELCSSAIDSARSSAARCVRPLPKYPSVHPNVAATNAMLDTSATR